MKLATKRIEKIGMGDFKFGPLERQYIQRVINSNRLSYGPLSKEFEARFSVEHGCKYGVFVNSGTSALHIALQALKERYCWEDEAEVLVPSVTFPATVNVILHNGLKPVFVDVDSKTYNMDPEKIKEKITNRTRAIVPVHLMGLPCDMEKICAIAKDEMLQVVEDSCEAMFVGQKGNPVGSFGDIGCFSTYVAHILVTGVGGICTTNNPELAVRIRSLANHGRDPAYLSIDDDDKKDVIDKRYRFLSVGHSFRATEMEAALGLAQMEQKELITRRKNLGAKYRLELEDLGEHLQLPSVPEGLDHAFMFFPLVVYGDCKKEFVRFLEDGGIETRDLMPLLRQPCYKRLGIRTEDYPVAKFLDTHGLAIGCHPHITDEQSDYVIERIHEFFSGPKVPGGYRA